MLDIDIKDQVSQAIPLSYPRNIEIPVFFEGSSLQSSHFLDLKARISAKIREISTDGHSEFR